MKLYSEDYSDIENFQEPIAAFPETRFVLLRLLVATENDLTVRRMIFADNARRFWGIV